MRTMIDFFELWKHEIIMFVDYENNVYTKHHKTFSKKCVLENDFFVCTKHMKKKFQLFSRSLLNTGKLVSFP